MKSLQNQYNLIKEGKGNKEIFLKEAKAQFPQYITNVQTFDQVIHSLTEKGIINEAMVLVSANRPTTPDWFKIFKENTNSHQSPEPDFPSPDPKYPKHKWVAQIIDSDHYLAKKPESQWDEKDHELFNRLYKQAVKDGERPKLKTELNEAADVKAELKETDETVEEMEIKGYDYKDRKNSSNISTAEILTGYYAEMKDPKNAEKTESEIKAIVFKNLDKDPLYYVKDGQFGIKGLGYTEEHPGLGPTKEVTGKYKSSGMEPVKLNETVLSEAKKRAIEKHIAEIEKMGEVAAWEHKIGKIQEKIEELTNKMTMTEGDDVKDMVDKKAVKELKKDIHVLEKKKALYEKQKAKAAKKVTDKSAMQTAAGKDVTVMETEEEKPFTPPSDPIRDRIKASMIRDTRPIKKESWTGMVRELINKKNLKLK